MTLPSPELLCLWFIMVDLIFIIALLYDISRHLRNGK